MQCLPSCKSLDNREISLTNNPITCHEVNVFLFSGITSFQSYTIKTKSRITDKSSSIFSPGRFYALASPVKGKPNKLNFIHTVFHLGHGIFMSKLGAGSIYFHTIESALQLYGKDLYIYEVSFSIKISCINKTCGAFLAQMAY